MLHTGTSRGGSLSEATANQSMLSPHYTQMATTLKKQITAFFLKVKSFVILNSKEE